MKTCNLCNKEKKIIEFVKRSNRTSGTQPYCKDCCRMDQLKQSVPYLVSAFWPDAFLIGLDLSS
jgi:hypothetical protein